MPSNNYQYQITNDLEKVLDQESAENISMIITLIFLVLYMHIGLTTFLEDRIFNVKFDIDERIYPISTSLN